MKLGSVKKILEQELGATFMNKLQINYAPHLLLSSTHCASVIVIGLNYDNLCILRKLIPLICDRRQKKSWKEMRE